VRWRSDGLAGANGSAGDGANCYKGRRGGGTSPLQKIVMSSAPAGPWSAPQAPVNSIDLSEWVLYPDFNYN